jgi:hypothetical protein
MRIPYFALPFAIAMMQGSAMAASAEQASPLLRDLEIVRTDFVMKSQAFSPSDRLAALALIAEERKHGMNRSKPEVIATLMRIAAFAHNGHDYFDTADGWVPDKRLPIRLAWFSDGLVVTRTSPEYSGLLGAHVIGIEGKEPAEILRTLQQFAGGTADYVKWDANWLLESPEMLKAIGIAGHADHVRIEFRQMDGTVSASEIVAAMSASIPLDQGRTGSWSRAASARERELGWKNAVLAVNDPFYLQEPNRLFRIVELPELDALYVQFRSNLDGAGESIAEFAQRVQQRLAVTPRHHVILDQRFNTGGNTDITMDLMRDIGRHTKGQIYVLIGSHTFSAGIVSTAIVKHESHNRAILVGEEVGDRLRWWSEGENVCLPHSKYCLHVTTGLWDLVHGCAGENGCYGDRFNASVPDLTPNIVAPLKSEDWVSGRDPCLDAVAHDLARLH